MTTATLITIALVPLAALLFAVLIFAARATNIMLSQAFDDIRTVEAAFEFCDFVHKNVDGSVHTNQSGTCIFVISKRRFRRRAAIRFTRDPFSPDAMTATLIWQPGMVTCVVATRPLELAYAGPGTVLPEVQQPKLRAGWRLLGTYGRPDAPFADKGELYRIGAELKAVGYSGLGEGAE